jgi:hypothetical protein
MAVKVCLPALSFVPNADERLISKRPSEDRAKSAIARSTTLHAEFTIDLARDWPTWLRDAADRHEKSAQELRLSADYIEANKIDLSGYSSTKE